MKELIILGGPMGVGKTAVSRALQRRLNNCVFLDGDWCWDARPFIVTEETKAMALDNMAYLLNSFLASAAYEAVVFCWVLHRREILDQLLSRLPKEGFRLTHVSLVCTPETLKKRLAGDISRGIRTGGVIDRGLNYLPLYDALDGFKLDTTSLTPDGAAEAILAMMDTSLATDGRG